MICGPADRPANKANLLGTTGRFLLDRDETKIIFDRTAGTMRTSWRPTMHQTGISGEDCELIRSAFLYDGPFFKTVKVDI